MGWSEAKRLPSEGPEPQLGPGRSRPFPQEATRMFRLLLTWPDRRPMIITIPAPSRGKAMLYCKNRWPNCDVEELR